MSHEPAVFHIRVSIRAGITFLPVIDRPLLPSVSIGFAPIVNWFFQRVLLAVGVRGTVAGKLQLVALAVVLVKGVGVLGFCSQTRLVETHTRFHSLLLFLAARRKGKVIVGNNILPRVSPAISKFTAYWMDL